MVNLFSNMNFQMLDVEFTDGRKMVSAQVTGKFSRQKVIAELQSLADAFAKKNKDYYMGVAVHYAHPDDWTPAIFKHVNQKQILYNPTDSETTNGYRDIDNLMFYIIKMPEGSELKQVMHKQKKQKSMFAKRLKDKNI